MPELPDVTVYVEALRERLVDRTLIRSRVRSLFVVRTYEPPLSTLDGRRCVSVERLGKRIVVGFDDDLFLVIHLMIAGRLLWKDGAGASPVGGKIQLAAFEFESGTLTLTEAGSKKRASVHLVRGKEGLSEHDRGGLEVSACSLEDFTRILKAENRTLKRALTHPGKFSGIGNAYSDEILHAAKLSPLRLTQSLLPAETERLFEATCHTLRAWTDRLRRDFKGRFPGVGEITAFRPDFAVHGRFSRPCPVCGVEVQRISYADNETNYCPRCQNEDRILADRSLSRLLKEDWPRTVEEMEGG